MSDKAKKIIISVAVAVLVFIIGALCFLLWQSKQAKPTMNVPTGSLTVDTTAEALNSDKTDVGGEVSYFTATGFFDVELKADDILALPNDPENMEDEIYVIYIVMNGDTEIYKSDLLEPGKQLNFKPGQILDKGDYELTIIQVPYMFNDSTGNWDEKYSSKQTIGVTIR